MELNHRSDSNPLPSSLVLTLAVQQTLAVALAGMRLSVYPWQELT